MVISMCVKLTQEQKHYLADARNIKSDYYQVVAKWIDREDMPANVEILFEHILSHKAKDQYLTIMDYNSEPDINLYDFDLQAQIYRRYPDGWYKVNNLVNHHPRFAKKR